MVKKLRVFLTFDPLITPNTLHPLQPSVLLHSLFSPSSVAALVLHFQILETGFVIDLRLHFQIQETGKISFSDFFVFPLQPPSSEQTFVFLVFVFFVVRICVFVSFLLYFFFVFVFRFLCFRFRSKCTFRKFVIDAAVRKLLIDVLFANGFLLDKEGSNPDRLCVISLEIGLVGEMNTLGALVEANELGVYDDDIVYELDVECAHEKSPSPENDGSLLYEQPPNASNDEKEDERGNEGVPNP
ncbi:hypothetical protein V2J09_006776 [Rumex salicifolius]